MLFTVTKHSHMGLITREIRSIPRTSCLAWGHRRRAAPQKLTYFDFAERQKESTLTRRARDWECIKAKGSRSWDRGPSKTNQRDSVSAEPWELGFTVTRAVLRRLPASPR